METSRIADLKISFNELLSSKVKLILYFAIKPPIKIYDYLIQTI